MFFKNYIMKALRILPIIAAFFVASCSMGKMDGDFMTGMPEAPGDSGAESSPDGDSGNSLAGVVTAGEWNDLDNWNFWNGLMSGQNEGKFYEYLNYWSLYTSDRFAVTVVDAADNAVCGAKVELFVNDSQKAEWTAITDNNGSLQQSSTVINGQQYNVATIQEIVLFPQKTGNLIIDPLDITCLAQVKQERNRSYGYDPFDDFFNDVMGSSYKSVKKDIKSQPITIEVEPLPTSNKPSSFKGAVGQFTFTSKIDKNELKVNEAFTLTLTVSGKGNIELLELPQPVFPPDFEVYDPKINTSVKNNAQGIYGNKSAEYIIIPRVSGDFTLNDIEFSYFNTSSKKYETLKSDIHTIQVQKGSGSNNSVVYTPGQADIKYLGSDIRHINTSNNKLNITGFVFFASNGYFAIIILMTIIFIAVLIINKKINKFNSDKVLVKNRKATKIAKKRFKNAHNHLVTNNQNRFYEEFSQAVWGYISDKLNIPLSQLSMDSVREIMTNRNVPEDIVNEFVDLLNTCEFARFAPGDANKKMDDLYQKGIELITKAEKLLK
jgi:hypothetical protein